tara:strand:- start:1576 stop:1950 length:375 start_codon:yes stop_codon:yes gene_type:complete
MNNNFENAIWLLELEHGKCNIISSSHPDFTASIVIDYCHLKALSCGNVVSTFEPQSIAMSVAILYKGVPKYYDHFSGLEFESDLFTWIRHFEQEPASLALDYASISEEVWDQTEKDYNKDITEY